MSLSGTATVAASLYLAPWYPEFLIANHPSWKLMTRLSSEERPPKDDMAAEDPDRDEVFITAELLPLGHLAARVVCPTAGAIATFIGTTRDHFEGKRVLRLEVCACVASGL